MKERSRNNWTFYRDLHLVTLVEHRSLTPLDKTLQRVLNRTQEQIEDRIEHLKNAGVWAFLLNVDSEYHNMISNFEHNEKWIKARHTDWLSKVVVYENKNAPQPTAAERKAKQSNLKVVK